MKQNPKQSKGFSICIQRVQFKCETLFVQNIKRTQIYYERMEMRKMSNKKMMKKVFEEEFSSEKMKQQILLQYERKEKIK